MQNLHLQARIDAGRKAAWIEKHAETYQRSPEYRFIVDNTVYLTDDQLHESMRAVGGTLRKGKI